MNVPRYRLICAVLLLAWLAPGVGAVGVGLHLTFGHHGHHDQLGHDGQLGHHADEHQAEFDDFVQLATHGHVHDFGSAPEHHDYARCDGQALVIKPGLSALAMLPAGLSFSVAPAERPHLVRPLRRVPPQPLFTANCSLLL